MGEQHKRIGARELLPAMLFIYYGLSTHIQKMRWNFMDDPSDTKYPPKFSTNLQNILFSLLLY